MADHGDQISPVVDSHETFGSSINISQTAHSSTSTAEKPLRAGVTVQSTSSSDSKDQPSGDSESYRWRPSFLRIRPLLGFAAIGLTLVCLLVSLAVLLASEGTPTRTWVVSPTVYLAITTALSNTALRCALAQAVPIAWLNKAVKGNTINGLELEWEAGQSFMRAIIRSVKNRQIWSLLTTAGLAVALVVIDGPLLQRASSVKLTTISKNITLDIGISPELPTGFCGTATFPRGNWGGIINESLTFDCYSITQAYIRGDPILSNATCPSGSKCFATVRAPGLDYSLEQGGVWPITPSMIRNTSVPFFNETTGIAPRSVFFNYMEPDGSPEDVEQLDMFYGGLNITNCQGAYTLIGRRYHAAIREYDIIIENRTITFANSASSGRVIAAANNTHMSNLTTNTAPNTFSLLSDQMVAYVVANASIFGENVDMSTANAFAAKHITNSANCNISSTDPTNDTVAIMNEVMFRAGIHAATLPGTIDKIDGGLSLHQIVQAEQTTVENVYHLELAWFFGAMAVQVVAMILILPSFWGWWDIGVELTLSPFLTAKMLDAPLLRNVNSAAGAKGIIQEMGGTRLKLGSVEVRDRTLSPADADESYAVATGSRVGLAEPYHVITPLKGARFAH